MMSNEASGVCKEAVEVFGADVQQMMAIEEMGELIQAISKKVRGLDHQANIPEEIADVEIMLEQLKYIHKCHQSVNYWRRKKIMRLASYIEKERFKGGINRKLAAEFVRKNMNIVDLNVEVIE